MINFLKKIKFGDDENNHNEDNSNLSSDESTLHELRYPLETDNGTSDVDVVDNYHTNFIMDS
jgi:hypothetical protein